MDLLNVIFIGLRNINNADSVISLLKVFCSEYNYYLYFIMSYHIIIVLSKFKQNRFFKQLAER